MEKDFLVQGLIVFDHLQMLNYKHLHVETLQWLVQSQACSLYNKQKNHRKWPPTCTNLFLQTQVLSKKKTKTKKKAALAF